MRVQLRYLRGRRSLWTSTLVRMRTARIMALFFRLKLTAIGFEDERIFRRNSRSSALPETRRYTSPASTFIRSWESAWQLDLLLAGGDVQAKT